MSYSIVEVQEPLILIHQLEMMLTLFISMRINKSMLRIEALKDIETEEVYKNSDDHVMPSHPFRCILSGVSGSGK